MVIKNTDYCLLTVVSYYFVARHETKWYSCLKIVVLEESMFQTDELFTTVAVYYKASNNIEFWCDWKFEIL